MRFRTRQIGFFFSFFFAVSTAGTAMAQATAPAPVTRNLPRCVEEYQDDQSKQVDCLEKFQKQNFLTIYDLLDLLGGMSNIPPGLLKEIQDRANAQREKDAAQDREITLLKARRSSGVGFIGGAKLQLANVADVVYPGLCGILRFHIGDIFDIEVGGEVGTQENFYVEGYLGPAWQFSAGPGQVTIFAHGAFTGYDRDLSKQFFGDSTLGLNLGGRYTFGETRPGLVISLHIGPAMAWSVDHRTALEPSVSSAIGLGAEW